MNKDRVKGRIEEAKVKQLTGNVVGDRTSKQKGKIEKASAAFKRAMAISRMN